MPVFPVDRDEEFGFYQIYKQLEFLLAAVTMNVNIGQPAINDMCALPEEIINGTVDYRFIAGYGSGGHYYSIAGNYAYLAVIFIGSGM